MDIKELTNASYYALEQLQPEGLVLPANPESNWGKLLRVFSAVFAGFLKSLELFEYEIIPHKTTWFIEEWEEALRLKEQCGGIENGNNARRVAIRSVLNARTSASVPDLIAGCELLGFKVQIQEHKQFRVGQRVGERLNGADWNHAFTVFVKQSDVSPQLFRAGDQVGSVLRVWGAESSIECFINRVKHAHTIAIFDYSN